MLIRLRNQRLVKRAGHVNNQNRGFLSERGLTLPQAFVR